MPLKRKLPPSIFRGWQPSIDCLTVISFVIKDAMIKFLQ